jgi:hypothetical protein
MLAPKFHRDTHVGSCWGGAYTARLGAILGFKLLRSKTKYTTKPKGKVGIYCAYLIANTTGVVLPGLLATSGPLKPRKINRPLVGWTRFEVQAIVLMDKLQH